jgi:hypothetical protein
VSKHNAALALKQDDRPASLRRKPQERLKAVQLAQYKTEDEIQREVAAYLDLKLPRDWRWYHPPNGGFRKQATANRLKAQGLKPGIPDCVILRPNGAPIYIELKSFGGTLSLAQKDFRDWCQASQQPYRVCRSVGEVEVFLKEYLA